MYSETPCLLMKSRPSDKLFKAEKSKNRKKKDFFCVSFFSYKFILFKNHYLIFLVVNLKFLDFYLLLCRLNKPLFNDISQCNSQRIILMIIER